MSMLQVNNISGNIQTVIEATNAAYSGGQPLHQALSVCQAILEAGLLRKTPSELALKYNNLFGIKGEGTGLMIDGKMQSVVIMQSAEYYVKTGWQYPDSQFAVNGSVEDSITQHGLLLQHPRYAKLNTANTFSEIAHYVKDCGYATDPSYPGKLISIYNKHLAPEA